MNQQKSVDCYNKFDRHNAAKFAARSENEGKNYATVRGFRPAAINYSQDKKGYQITLVSLETPADQRQGGRERTQTLRFTGQSPEAIRQELQKRYGSDVVFSVVPSKKEISTPVSEAKAAVIAERQAREQARQEQEEIRQAVAAYRELCQQMTPEEREAQFSGVCLEMMQTLPEEFAGAGDFFQWPVEDGKSTNRNYAIWKEIVHAQGVPENCVPALYEAVRAFEYGVTHGHFFAKSYKRSEYFLRDAVKPVNAGNLQADTESLQQSARRKLAQRRLPTGFRVTWERAEQMGLTEEEFQSLVQEHDSNRDRDFSELQQDVRSQRRPRSRAELAMDWTNI